MPRSSNRWQASASTHTRRRTHTLAHPVIRQMWAIERRGRRERSSCEMPKLGVKRKLIVLDTLKVRFTRPQNVTQPSTCGSDFRRRLSIFFSRRKMSAMCSSLTSLDDWMKALIRAVASPPQVKTVFSEYSLREQRIPCGLRDSRPLFGAHMEEVWHNSALSAGGN